jgi:hypothetical protein
LPLRVLCRCLCFLKGSYTEADSRSVSAWMQVRLAGISSRNKYTKFCKSKVVKSGISMLIDWLCVLLFRHEKKQNGRKVGVSGRW